MLSSVCPRLQLGFTPPSTAAPSSGEPVHTVREVRPILGPVMELQVRDKAKPTPPTPGDQGSEMRSGEWEEGQQPAMTASTCHRLGAHDGATFLAIPFSHHYIY